MRQDTWRQGRQSDGKRTVYIELVSPFQGLAGVALYGFGEGREDRGGDGGGVPKPQYWIRPVRALDAVQSGTSGGL